MKRFMMCLVAASALVSSVAFADQTEPNRTTVKVIQIVGNPRRPAVTIELTKQKLAIPLHEMKHPLDEKALTSAAPL
jgi:opacity protein-like surface antigen